jgi:hypothetical protein
LDLIYPQEAGKTLDVIYEDAPPLPSDLDIVHFGDVGRFEDVAMASHTEIRMPRNALSMHTAEANQPLLVRPPAWGGAGISRFQSVATRIRALATEHRVVCTRLARYAKCSSLGLPELRLRARAARILLGRLRIADFHRRWQQQA